MIASSPARLAVVEPNGPDDVLVPGFTASTRLTAAQTGSISIVEHTFAPGSLVPPHRHTREDEISYVVSGEIGFRSDDREVFCEPAATSSSRAASSTRCGTPRRNRRG